MKTIWTVLVLAGLMMFGGCARSRIDRLETARIDMFGPGPERLQYVAPVTALCDSIFDQNNIMVVGSADGYVLTHCAEWEPVGPYSPVNTFDVYILEPVDLRFNLRARESGDVIRMFEGRYETGRYALVLGRDVPAGLYHLECVYGGDVQRRDWPMLR